MDDTSLKYTIQIPNTPFCVRMNEEKTRAWLCRSKQMEWTVDEDNYSALVNLLRRAGFYRVETEGLLEALPKILSDNEKFLFSEGVPPVHGEDGYISFHFETDPLAKIWEQQDEAQVDFRNRLVFSSVSPQDVLAELNPPSEPKDGVDVLGKPIHAKPGKKAVLRAGRNVEISPDQTKAYSLVEGCPKKIRALVSVDNVRVIDGDIDFSTGNINFNGDVIVRGDVRETFSVTAKGNITIHGVVDRATLKADADISILGGLYGKDEVSVEAGGNISLAFAENANLNAGGNLYVTSALINCEAYVAGTIFMKAVGKSLIGGHVIAEYGIEANCLGNPRLPTKTLVEFGVRPELLHKLRQLQAEFEHASVDRRFEIRDELDELRERYEKQTKAHVAVKMTTFSGVILRSASVKYEVKNDISSMEFYKLPDKNEISMKACVTKRGRL